MATAPTTERGRRTQRRIVAAAQEVVAERGAAATSLDEVGSRASTSRSQLYHYFDDRMDLLAAVARATNDLVLYGQRDLFAALGSWDGLLRWADALVAAQEQPGGTAGCPLANLLSQAGRYDDGIRAVLVSGFDRWEEQIRGGLAAMVDTDELRPDTDVAWLATVVLASLQGGLVLAQARKDPHELRRALDGALALVGSYRSTQHPA